MGRIKDMIIEAMESGMSDVEAEEHVQEILGSSERRNFVFHATEEARRLGLTGDAALAFVSEAIHRAENRGDL